MSILFIRSQTIEFDGRIQKYLKTLDKNKIKYLCLSWDRAPDEIKNKKNPNVFYYSKKAKTGAGWKNFVNILKWNFFVCYFITKNHKNFDTLHIVDFDSYFLPFWIAKFLKKNTIFDIYDKYTSSRHFPKYLSYFVDKIERFYIKKSTYSFLADESRIKQHNIKSTKNIRVFENVPQWAPLQNSVEKISDKILIGYFGILEKSHRGLENLLQATILQSNFEVHISGFGPLKNEVVDYSNQYPNKIFYHGPLEHHVGMELMNKMDIIAALYYKTIENHLYAAPNKYFEHLMLGKPLITSANTPPGNKVKEFQTGWAIDDDLTSLDNLLKSITSKEIHEYSKNALNLWDTKYKFYITEKYENEYLKIIKSMGNT